jgi:small-conductance mechanosensitive channel
MWWQLSWPAVAFVATAVVALTLRAVIVSALSRWFGGHGFLDVIRLPSILWCLVLALYVAIGVADLPRRLSQDLGVILTAAIIVSVTFTIASVIGSVIARAGERRAVGGPVTGLAQTAARVGILLVGALVLLDALGIKITPILTALGVGGLAVALALQDSLGNLFAGMHLLADKPIRVGDYVKLGDNVEGYVLDVGWRSTRLRMLQNNEVVIPNSKVAQSVIINYDLPESRMALVMKVSVAYSADLDLVESALVDEATQAAAQIPGLLADPKPLVRLIPGFGDWSLDLTLICHVASFVDQYLVQHELRKRILRRFRAEGIEIPFPTRTVETRATPGDGRPTAAR